MCESNSFSDPADQSVPSSSRNRVLALSRSFWLFDPFFVNDFLSSLFLCVPCVIYQIKRIYSELSSFLEKNELWVA